MGVYLGQSVYNDSQVTPEWVEEEIAKNGKGVFFATYGQTTYQNILQEYNNGKIIVVKYEPVTPGETTTYYFNLVQFNTETFDFVGVMGDGTIYRTGINANEGWTNITTLKLDEIEFVEYNVDSYTTIKSHYDNGKFIVLKYMQQTPLVTKYFFYPLVSVDETNKEFVFGSLELGLNNKKVTFTVTDSGGWAVPAESPAVVVDASLDSSSHNPVENMAIAAELTAINNKITGDLNDIFLALASKGVTVPAGAGLDDVAGLIDDIPAGTNYKIIGGREYQTVVMPDGKEWLAQNLDYKFCSIGVNGVPNTAAAWYFDNNESLYGLNGARKCGLLYNGYAVELLEQNKSSLCPGWHVATREEWGNLANAIGANAAIKLKAVNPSWGINWVGTDDYGFKVLPTGTRGTNGNFFNVGSSSYYCSAQYESGSSNLLLNTIFYNTDSGLIFYYDDIAAASSIRLVRD